MVVVAAAAAAAVAFVAIVVAVVVVVDGVWLPVVWVFAMEPLHDLRKVVGLVWVEG